jgi:hypothetical protein
MFDNLTRKILYLDMFNLNYWYVSVLQERY